MLTGKILPILLTLSLLVACSPGITATPIQTLSSGIEGSVTRGPVCPGPVRVGDTSCQDQPYQANITILDAESNPVSRFQADSNGYFKIPLKPGTYILHPEGGKPLPIATEQTVIVTENQFTLVLIQYDTGIR